MTVFLFLFCTYFILTRQFYSGGEGWGVGGEGWGVRGEGGG